MPLNACVYTALVTCISKRRNGRCIITNGTYINLLTNRNCLE